MKERYDQIKGECSDLVSVEAKYHRNCQKSFYAHCDIPELREGEIDKGGRPVDNRLYFAFNSVIEYLDENEDCQYLMSDLKSIFDANINDTSISYGERHLTKKLEQYYGDKMIVTRSIGKQTINTFNEKAHDISRETWKSQTLSEN